MDYTNIKLSYIVPLYLQNEQSAAVLDLITKYESYDKDILNQIYFVFIDDCSPVPITINTTKLNYILVRITDDITWNQGGARNLGVHYAKSSKLIVSDLDHHFSEQMFKHVLSLAIPKSIYTFRRTVNGSKTNTHPNTFFCTKAIFNSVLGVDEEFCGHYGYEDIYFQKLIKKIGIKIRKIRKYSIEHVEHKNEKENTQHFLIRDTKRNKELLDQKLSYLNTKDPFRGHSRKYLQFNWQVISEHCS